MEKQHCPSHSGMEEKVIALNNTIAQWGKALCIVISVCTVVIGGVFSSIGIPAITQAADLKTKIAEEFAKRDLKDIEMNGKIEDHAQKITRLEDTVYKRK